MPAGRDEELKRKARILLNKVSPDNLGKIAQDIVDAGVQSSAELEMIIGQIHEKSLKEMHYCETYADLVHTLHDKMPEFPNPEGGKPLTFKKSLINVCQEEFDQISRQNESSEALEVTEGMSAEDIDFKRNQVKKRILGLMKFIGHLYLRKLLSAKIILSIIQDLAGCDSDAGDKPADHIVECICELLTNVGYTLEHEQGDTGKKGLGQVFGRLKDLKSMKGKDNKPSYKPRIQFTIQDLLDCRAAGWTKKVFNAAAKTKEEIRLDQERELASGKTTNGAARVIAGKKPEYLASQEESASGWQEVPPKPRR